MDSDEIAVVKAFMAAINRADISAMTELMAEDHTCVVPDGSTVRGRDEVIAGWPGYFEMFPDYRVDVEDILQDGNLVAVFGSAFGTYNGKRGLVTENVIEMPAAWRAIVRDGKIKLWQVYADWSEGGRIIDEDGKSG